MEPSCIILFSLCAESISDFSFFKGLVDDGPFAVEADDVHRWIVMVIGVRRVDLVEVVGGLKEADGDDAYACAEHGCKEVGEKGDHK
jgi:hypothetical protein